MTPLYILAGALFVLPLAGPIIWEPIVAIPDIWKAKEFYAVMAILAIVLARKSRGAQSSGCKQNPFLTTLLLFLPISAYASPPFALIYGHENLGGFWIWKSMAWCFAYFLLYQTITANHPVRERHKMAIVRAIGWAAIMSAGYAYLQALGVDQWQIARSISEIGQPAAVNITAMIGNPTYLSNWLAMCLPFLMLFFRWYWVVFVLGAVILCKSDISLVGAAIVVPVTLACSRARSTIWIKVVAGVGLTAIVLLVANWSEIRPYVAQRANGRLAVWEQAYEDFRAPCIKLPVTEDMSSAQRAEVEKLNKRTYTMTGRGLGSWPFIFAPKYTTNFESAHSEYLETLYSIGIIGLGLLLAAIGFVLYHAFQAARVDPFAMALYASFIFICFAAAGLPIWHLEPLRFYCVAVFCLLSGISIQKDPNDG